jgi:hypothetical protein
MLREEHTLRVFSSSVLRRIFEPEIRSNRKVKNITE